MNNTMLTLLFLQPPVDFWQSFSGLADVHETYIETGEEYISLTFDPAHYSMSATEFRAKIDKIEYFKDLFRLCPNVIAVKGDYPVFELMTNVSMRSLIRLAESQTRAFNNTLMILISKGLPDIGEVPSVRDLSYYEHCAMTEPAPHPFERFKGASNAKRSKAKRRK